MTKYIRNEFGGIHSIEDEITDADGKTPYEKLLVLTPGGQKFLPAGWGELTEADAKKAHPQLFGKSDPMVQMNARERMDAASLAQFDKE